MLSDIQTTIISAVQNNPGIGPGPVADFMGRDKSLTRRDMRNLAKRGHLIERNNGNGYAYFPAGGRLSETILEVKPAPARHPEFPKSTGNL